MSPRADVMEQLPYILAGIVLMTLQPVLVTLSQNAQGHLDYSPISSTLLTESAKIGISLVMLCSSKAPVSVSGAEMLQYAVPAFIYFVNNNLVFVILGHVDATTFQLLSQLKTVFTGILFRVFLSRHLSIFQYLAIVQLACGTATSQIPLCSGPAQVEGRSSALGVLLSVLSCLLSAFGGIYSEKLLKDKPKDSIHWQNIQLYSWGIAFNLLGVAVQKGSNPLGSGFFGGLRGWAWAVILNNALNGLAISAILKYADNIARVYAHACAMLVTMVLSIFLFAQTPSAQLLVAIAMVSASAVQYNLRQPEPVSAAASAYHNVPSGEEGRE
ncbi:nucleotide-sugar transporter-domain-containing protein [Pavlovales sp. CCMP2436]|nr:nucleotide-sugar transporter-domain-containing protein [Pavlovales sp. CCMP2436]